MFKDIHTLLFVVVASNVDYGDGKSTDYFDTTIVIISRILITY